MLRLSFPAVAGRALLRASYPLLLLGLVACGGSDGDDPPANDAAAAVDADIDFDDGGLLDAAPGDDAGSTIDAAPATPGATMVSYLGGSSNTEIVGDQGRDVAVDAAGNWYVVGGLDRMSGAPFTGALGRTIGTRNREDIFVVSFDREGALRYATLIGGPNYDRAYAVEVDDAGRVVVAGRAGDGFPTTAGALQENFAGDPRSGGAYGKQDGVIFMLEADGSLAWATYFGSAGSDFIRDVALGPDGSIFVGVAEVAGAFPYATSGAFIDTPPSGTNHVLAKLAADGSSVLWAGYLGTSGDENSPPTVQVDDNGVAAIAWGTPGTDAPVTAGAYQTSHGGGNDMVVAKVAADGQSLIYCTYFGGTGDENIETHQIAVAPGGEVVIITSVDTSCSRSARPTPATWPCPTTPSSRASAADAPTSC